MARSILSPPRSVNAKTPEALPSSSMPKSSGIDSRITWIHMSTPRSVMISGSTRSNLSRRIFRFAASYGERKVYGSISKGAPSYVPSGMTIGIRYSGSLRISYRTGSPSCSFSGVFSGHSWPIWSSRPGRSWAPIIDVYTQ